MNKVSNVTNGKAFHQTFITTVCAHLIAPQPELEFVFFSFFLYVVVYINPVVIVYGGKLKY